MANLSKKRVFSPQIARTKNRSAIARKPARAPIGSEIDFDPARQLNRPCSPNPFSLARSVGVTRQPRRAQPAMDDHREPQERRPGRQSFGASARVSHLSEGDDVPLKRLLGSVQIGTMKIP
jgi:hypothetical protein